MIWGATVLNRCLWQNWFGSTTATVGAPLFCSQYPVVFLIPAPTIVRLSLNRCAGQAMVLGESGAANANRYVFRRYCPFPSVLAMSQRFDADGGMCGMCSNADSLLHPTCMPRLPLSRRPSWQPHCHQSLAFSRRPSSAVGLSQNCSRARPGCAGPLCYRGARQRRQLCKALNLWSSASLPLCIISASS